jgi:hypothetical protein
MQSSTPTTPNSSTKAHLSLLIHRPRAIRNTWCLCFVELTNSYPKTELQQPTPSNGKRGAPTSSFVPFSSLWKGGEAPCPLHTGARARARALGRGEPRTRFRRSAWGAARSRVVVLGLRNPRRRRLRVGWVGSRAAPAPHLPSSAITVW